MKSVFGSGGGGGGGSFTQTPDNLRSTDTFEALLGVCAGPIVGPTNGLKSLNLDGTPIQDEAGHPNFENFIATYADGDPAKFPQPTALAMGAGAAPTSVGLTLSNDSSSDSTPGPWVTKTVSNVGPDAIDLRFVVNQLFRQDDKGIFTDSAIIEVQMKPVGATTWTSIGASTGTTTTLPSGKAAGTFSLAGGGTGNFSNSNGKITITGKTTSPTVFEMRITVPNTTPYNNKSWDIRCRLNNREKVQQDPIEITRNVYWESASAVFRQTFGTVEDWRGLAWLHLQGKASDQLNGVPDVDGEWDTKIVSVPPSGVFDPVARTYSGTLWNGTYAKAFTTDPAWIINDAVSDALYGISFIAPGSYLNKWDALEASKWFSTAVTDGASGTEPRCSLNMVVDSPQKADELIQNMAGAVGAICWEAGGGEWRMKVDKPENPVDIFTVDNIEGEFTYSSTDLDTRFNDITMTFLNKEFGYREDRVRVKDDTHIAKYGRKPTSLVAMGCTGRQEALRRAVMRLRTSINETRIVSFTTNRRARLLRVLDTILVADNSLGYRLPTGIATANPADVTIDDNRTTGRIVAYDSIAKKITLRDTVRLEIGATYALRFAAPNANYTPSPSTETTVTDRMKPTTVLSRAVVNSSGQRGDVKDIYLDAVLPGDIAEYGTVAIEAVGLPANPKAYRILEIKPSEDGERIAVSAIEIDSGKWAAADAGVVETGASNVVRDKQVPAPLPPDNGEILTLTTVKSTPTDKRQIAINWKRPASTLIGGFKVTYILNGAAPVTLAASANTAPVELINPSNGLYEFFIYAYDRNGRMSQPLTASAVLDDLQLTMADGSNLDDALAGTKLYRSTGYPTNAPIPTGFTTTTNSNGTVNYTLSWDKYVQGARQADSLILFWRKDGTAPTLSDSAIQFNVNLDDDSYYIFEGVNPAETFSFGIAAARRTEKGLEVGPIVTPTGTGVRQNLVVNSSSFADASWFKLHSKILRNLLLQSGAFDNATWTAISAKKINQNLVIYSNQFENAAWTKLAGGTGSAPTVAARVVNGPTKDIDARNVTFNVGAGTTTTDQSMLKSTAFTTVTSQAYTSGIYVKGSPGTKLVQRHVAAGTYTLITLTGGWDYITGTETAAGTSSTFEIGIKQGLFGTINSSATVRIAQASVNLGSAIGTYIETTSAALSIAYPDPFGGTTAFELMDLSTSAFQGIQQAVTVPNDSNPYTFSIYLKKQTSVTTPVFGINLGLSGGTAVNSSFRIDPVSGTFPYALTTGTIESVGDFWRVSVPIANNTTGNTTLTVSLYPAAAANGGTTDNVAAVGSAILAAAQLAVGTIGGDYQATTTTALSKGYLAPDGTMTAELLLEDTTATSTHPVYTHTPGPVSGTPYVGSCYIKPANGVPQARITLGNTAFADQFGTFNFDTETATAGGGATSVAMTKLADGWYRCSVVATADTTADGDLVIEPSEGGSNVISGDGVSGIYVWGPQLEKTALSDYLPTNGTAVTINSPDWLGVTSGTPNYTANIQGSAAAVVVSNAAGAFDGTVLYRTEGAPTNIPFPIQLSTVTNSNGTVNYKLDWDHYPQGAKQADLLILFWRKDGTAPTINDSSVSFNVNTKWRSYYVLEGVNPADTFSFGLAAARRTENGLEVGAIQTFLGTEVRTNLILQSETFDNASWTKAGLAGTPVVANALAAPDGNTTADRIVSGTTGGSNTAYIEQVQTVSPGNIYALSMYLQWGTSPKSLVNFYRVSPFAQAFADITWGPTPTMVASGAILLGSYITPVARDWYRVGMLISADLATSLNNRLYVRDGNNNVSGEYVYAWGAQLESANLLANYNDFSNATSWGKANSTVTANNATDPLGTTTADTWTRTATGNHYIYQTIGGKFQGRRCRASVWMKLGTLTGTVKFFIDDGAASLTYRQSVTHTVTGSWAEYSFEFTLDPKIGDGLTFYIDPSNDAGSAGDTMFLWAANIVPLDDFLTPYVPTTTASASATAPDMLAVTNGTPNFTANVGGTAASTVATGANAANAGVNSDGTIKTDKVATAAMVANAATVPGSAYTASGPTVTSFASNSTVQTFTYTATGAQVLITANSSFSITGTGSVSGTFILKRGSTVIYTSGLVQAAVGGVHGAVSFPYMDTPSAGSVTYTLEFDPAVTTGAPTQLFANSAINVLELKK